MSTSEDETTEPTETIEGAETPGVDDAQLPEDLQPGDDNPLAGGLDDGESVGDLLEDGKRPEGSEESEDGESAGSDESSGGDGAS